MQTDRIHILDETISSKIAAGEVIINPASVVKELIENAIDAKATSITLEIKNGGKQYIRITDNGVGMSENDIKLCTQKHATSKVLTINDLHNINTLGFRGEALYAISSVSHFTIKSRQKESECGSQITINGGGNPEFSICGSPDGTTVKVKNLFFNIPARRKFLKSDATECANVANVISKMIIANPQVAFKYISNDNVIYQTLGTGKIEDALRAVFGKDMINKLVPIKISNEQINIEGFISRPAFQFKTRKNQLFILNGRYFDSKQISQAIKLGYDEYNLTSHYPAAYIYMTLSPQYVDVNVHPAKTQLLFYDEDFLIDTLSKGIIELLSNLPPENITQVIAESNTNKSANLNNYTSSVNLKDANRLYVKNNNFLSTSAGTSYADIDYINEAKGNEDTNIVKQLSTFDLCDKNQTDCQNENIKKTVSEHSKAIYKDSLKIIGQLFNTYILCEGNDTLYIIDQHAGHERLNFEKLKKQTQNGNISTQYLITPLVKKFSQKDFNLLSENESWLNEIGFEFEEFGNLTFKFTGLPVSIYTDDNLDIIEDLLLELRKNNRDSILVKKENIIRNACRRSVKAGDKLSLYEIETLVSEIIDKKTIPTCPHGRPIVTVINKSDLEKGFKRII